MICFNLCDEGLPGFSVSRPAAPPLIAGSPESFALPAVSHGRNGVDGCECHNDDDDCQGDGLFHDAEDTPRVSTFPVTWPKKPCERALVAV